METLGDLLADDRRTGDPAVRVPGDPAVTYDDDEFVTTAWKTANFFSHRGVHRGATVAVVDDHAAPALLALFGAAQLGATTRFVAPPADDGAGPSVDARLLVGPGESVLAYDLPPGATRVAYTPGPGVDDPAVEPFGRSVWSENPVRPPESVDPDATALTFEERDATHSDLLRSAENAAADLGPGDEVAVRASLTHRDAVVRGVLAPLLAGATVVFGGGENGSDAAVVVE
ncbi:hypothetical protein BRC81_08470 [Halobacteriales archaeon QS_1_68_20]|nr:MAG: hypothetical protein BRC81_08470 [Halobacteriales archaeon QS_1_68_20]